LAHLAGCIAKAVDEISFPSGVPCAVHIALDIVKIDNSIDRHASQLRNGQENGRIGLARLKQMRGSLNL
jgi:hypothetical protein